MANKIVDTIRRTGTACTPTRRLVVVQGNGKKAVSTTLSTVIEKITWAPQFRGGGAARPMEQYAFKVDGVVYERFADATAKVLKKHHVMLHEDGLENAQTYVQEAYKILKGEKGLRILSEIPADASPAIRLVTVDGDEVEAA